MPAKKSGSLRRRLSAIGAAFIALYVLIGVAASYWAVWRAADLAVAEGNRRPALALGKVARGRILDRSGAVLAESTREGAVYKRHYQVPEGLSQLVGYIDPRFGRAGVERYFDSVLSGAVGEKGWRGALREALGLSGASDVTLTVDRRASLVAERALKATGRPGAVVALDVATGGIVVLASLPGFDPATLERDWPALSSAQTSPFLNRALSGLYPPGSVFKTVVSAAILEKGWATPDTPFYCTGERWVDGQVIRDFNGVAHGSLTLRQALAVSCNVTFSGLGMALGPKTLGEFAARFGIGEDWRLGLPAARSVFPAEATDAWQGAELGIGQGSLVVTPLDMAVVAATIARGGSLVPPYIVEKGGSRSGLSFRQAVSPLTAARLKEMMVLVVDEGTGSAARIAGVRVAGKTGSAENPRGAPHAWFIGFAPAENPKYAISVVVENGGLGGQVAAPVAGRVLLFLLSQQQAQTLEVSQ